MKRRINPFAAQIVLQQNQQTKPSQADGLMLELHQCFDALKNGSTDEELFNRLGSSLNTALILAERIDQQVVDVVLDAHQAMYRCRERFDKHGRFGFDGPGISAMVDALDVYDQIVRLTTPKQILGASAEAFRRMVKQMEAA